MAQRDQDLTVIVGIIIIPIIIVIITIIIIPIFIIPQSIFYDHYYHNHNCHNHCDNDSNDQRHTLCLCNTTLCNTHKNDISGSSRCFVVVIINMKDTAIIILTNVTCSKNRNIFQHFCSVSSDTALPRWTHPHQELNNLYLYFHTSSASLKYIKTL